MPPEQAMPYELLVQSVVDYAIYVLDPSGLVISWNPGAELIKGYSQAEIIGRHFSLFYTEEDREAGRPQIGLATAAETGRFAAEGWRVRKNGERFRASVVIDAIHDDKGEIVGFAKITRDITEQYNTRLALMEAREELLRSELDVSDTTLRMVSEAAGIGIWDFDVVNDSLHWDDRVQAMFGMAAGEEVRWTAFRDCLHPDDYDSTMAAFDRLLDPEIREVFDVEYRAIGHDGVTRWIAARGRGVFDEQGRCVRAVGSAVDVTSHRLQDERQRLLFQMSDQLRSASDLNAALRDVCETMGRHFSVQRTGYGRLDRAADTFDYQVCWADDGVPPLLGVLPASAFGTKIVADLQAGRTVAIDNLFEDPLSADEPGTLQTARAVDTRAIVVVPMVDRGELRSIVYLNAREPRQWTREEVAFVEAVAERTREVTERRRAEEALLEETQALAILNGVGRQLAQQLDLDVLVQAVVDAGVQLSGARFGAFFYNLAGKDGSALMLYALAGAERKDFEGFGMPRETPVFAPTFRGEGIVRSDDITADPRYGHNAPNAGMPKGHLPVRSYLAAPVVGRSGEVIGALMFGHPEPAKFSERVERLLGGLAAQAAVAIDNARLFQAVTRAKETLEARVEERQQELARAEEALRQSQKMEAIGQLTGGIAHDFNNLLTGIIGSLNLMQRRLESGRTEGLSKFMEAATTSAQRAAALTHRLLAFARRQSLDARSLDVNQLVVSMEDLLRRSLGERIELSTRLAPAGWRAFADANQLENAILNLAINSRDAMPEGGRLIISTDNIVVDAATTAQHPDLAPGEYIAICVSDTGVGMSQEVVDKAFEPFFTTKPIGQGTGLGLSMIYGFAKQSRGHARIESAPHQGAKFWLYLPRHREGDDNEAPDKAAPADLEAPQGAGETVLVVEDDPAVRLLVTEVLAELGYAAIEAVDGLSALPVIEGDARIDLLVTDVGLPGLNGRQLAEMARQHRPGLRTLFITGYAENAASRETFLAPGMDMLTKPFSLEILAARIRGMIEGETSRA